MQSVTYFGSALAWPALYGAIFFAVLLCLLVEAETVALFAQDDKAREQGVQDLQ
jgi:hypothetical protein